MKQLYYQQIFSLLMVNLLLSPLSLAAIVDVKDIKLSDDEEQVIKNYDNTYVYLGNEISHIGSIISSINNLNDDKRSILHALQDHIEKGFLIGLYDEVLEALRYAEIILQNKSGILENNQREELWNQFNNIVQQITKGQLNINRSSSCGCPLTLNRDVIICGDAAFKSEVDFCDNVFFKDDVFFDNNVTIEGALTVTDLVVLSCMDNLCVNNLSVVDESISGTLSVNNGVFGALNIDCDLTVGCNISMNDSTSTAVGNIIKDGSPFIHNFGTRNTCVGEYAGNFTMTGISNSGFGFNALMANTIGEQNVAVGTFTLAANTIGRQNTAVGYAALRLNTIGNANVAVGANALVANTTGALNAALGHAALRSNVTGMQNVAVGHGALVSHLADSTVAMGVNALSSNTTGAANTAIGHFALSPNVTGSGNTALGNLALASSTGDNNIGIGNLAGITLTTGSGNIYIGADAGTAAESAAIRIGAGQVATFIAGIRGATTGVNNAIAVLIDSAGQLGTISSSIHVKDQVMDMNDDSSKVLDLNPVTFVYKNDAAAIKQYGLIAEEVAKIFPSIVVNDENGNPFTVQYHVLPVLLLNEIKKQQMRFALMEERLAALEARA